MSLVLWSLAFTLTLLALRGTMRRLAPLPAVKTVLLPGMLVGMASRALACALARAPVKAVHPPWSPGEPIEHDAPLVPLFGHLALGLLPLAAGSAAIIALRQLLEPSLTVGHALPAMEPGPGALAACVEGAAGMVKGAAAAAADPALRSWHAAAFLYLAVSILVYAAPRLSEWAHVAASIAGAALFLAALDFLGLRAGWLSRGWYIRKYYGPVAAEGLALLLALSLLTLAASALALGLARPLLSSRARKKPEGQKGKKPAK
jgi:hypothetical protein